MCLAQYFLTKYGFSILEVLRQNRQEKNIRFGRPSGARICDFYMSLTRTTGNGEVLPLFPDIEQTSRSFTFTAPAGMLFSTQFTQPALVLAELGQAVFT